MTERTDLGEIEEASDEEQSLVAPEQDEASGKALSEGETDASAGDPGEVDGVQVEEGQGFISDMGDADAAAEDSAEADAECDAGSAAEGFGDTVLETLMPQVEALLISADRSLSAGRLSDLLGGPGVRPVNEAVARLNSEYESSGRAFRIEEVAGGWRVFCLAEFGELVGQLHKTRQQTRLTPAMLETLSIIAYRQPILRADLEAIRGVACGEAVRGLMDMRLVRITGRAEQPGRPMLYGTTRQFLEVFGLSHIKELPSVEEFKKRANG